MIWLFAAHLAGLANDHAPSSMGRDAVKLYTGADYPPEAVRKGWEGTVVAQVVISVEGRVRACRIVKSSGHETLDAATCRILKTRALFVPAKDSAGRPVEDVLRTPPIEWRLQH